MNILSIGTKFMDGVESSSSDDSLLGGIGVVMIIIFMRWLAGEPFINKECPLFLHFLAIVALLGFFLITVFQYLVFAPSEHVLGSRSNDLFAPYQIWGGLIIASLLFLVEAIRLFYQKIKSPRLT